MENYEVNEDILQNTTSKNQENEPNRQPHMPPSYEENVIWDLEVWKRAEQTKFKAYLKQLEYEFLNKLSDEFKQKEEEREKEIKSKVNELNILQTRLKKKASELETRENKVSLMEEELRIKMNEVARQLANKEEEIVYYNRRFKEIKADLEKEKQNLVKQLGEKEIAYEKLEMAFRNFKKEIDESPVSVLKNELNRKSLELEEQVREKDRVIAEREKFKQQTEKLKVELIKIKKLFEQEKEGLYKQKMDDIEKLKFEIYNQRISQNELNELQELRLKLKQLTDKEKDEGNVNIANNTKRKEYKVVTIKKGGTNKYSSSNTYNIKYELEKLNAEKMSLLNSRMYTENDPLIIQIDNRLRRLMEMEN